MKQLSQAQQLQHAAEEEANQAMAQMEGFIKKEDTLVNKTYPLIKKYVICLYKMSPALILPMGDKQQHLLITSHSIYDKVLSLFRKCCP